MTNNKQLYKELINFLKQKPLPEKEVNRKKRELCKKYNTGFIPTNIQILLNADEKELPKLKYLQTKPTRSISGVSVIALMTKPFPCPHARKGISKKSTNKEIVGEENRDNKNVGPCIYCPGGPKSVFGNVPQSYTGKEPSTMRGIRNFFDSYLETFNRLEQYVVLGHNFDKVELIVMGGTFGAFPKKYREDFIRCAFKAMNDFSKMFYDNIGRFNIIKFRKFFLLPGEVGDNRRTKEIHKKLLKLKIKNRTTLDKEQLKNEKAKIRCVGLTLETRPDCVTIKEANQMLRLGATRVETGVQTVYDNVLKRINRGHTTKETIEATKLLKDLGFKINYHVMPGLPDVSYKQDLDALKELFRNQNYRPDMLKIYPCLVMKGTKLYDEWKQGRFQPLTTEKAAKLIAEFKRYVPEYVRIMRVQRDIPSNVISAGVDRTNLRQYIEKIMKDKNIRCRCIRCREVGHVLKKNGKTPKKVELIVRKYAASKGEEYFVSLEDKQQDILLGFCRLRFPSKDSVGLRKDITGKSALIRELHVLGEAVEIGRNGRLKAKYKEARIQHKGLGKRLIKKAEEIAKQNRKDKMVVISGIGAREYYRKLGYKKDGVYMVKKI